MTLIAYGLFVLATSASLAGPVRLGSASDDAVGVKATVTQMLIQRRVIVRVPAVLTPVQPPRPIKWKEIKGPKCVPLNQLAGAAIGKEHTVDLFLRGGARMRALLDNDCPALDYYSGFYISPSADGQVCERRDMLHTRAGQQCRVERFRTLVSER